MVLIWDLGELDSLVITWIRSGKDETVVINKIDINSDLKNSSDLDKSVDSPKNIEEFDDFHLHKDDNDLHYNPQKIRKTLIWTMFKKPEEGL